MLVTVVAQFTAETTNSEKAIYFLSLISCLVNKLKSHMLLKCKKFMFPDFKWKKIWLQEMVGEGDLIPSASLFFTAQYWIFKDFEFLTSCLLQKRSNFIFHHQNEYLK